MYYITMDLFTPDGETFNIGTPRTDSIIHATNQLEAFQQVVEMLCSVDVISRYNLSLKVIPSYCL